MATDVRRRADLEVFRRNGTSFCGARSNDVRIFINGGARSLDAITNIYTRRDAPWRRAGRANTMRSQDATRNDVDNDDGATITDEGMDGTYDANRVGGDARTSIEEEGARRMRRSSPLTFTSVPMQHL